MNHDRLRVVAVSPVAGMIALGLFFVMHLLIASPPSIGEPGGMAPSILFGIEIEPIVPDPEPPPPPEPPEIEDPPERPRMPTPVAQEPVRDPPRIPNPGVLPGSGPGVPVFSGAGGAAMGDGSGLARVRIQPSYPGPARLRGIEGEVIVEFTVTETGSVVSPRVIEANPPRVFDRAAMRAILKWKFRPKKVDGRPVAHTVRQIFTFRMEQG